MTVTRHIVRRLTQGIMLVVWGLAACLALLWAGVALLWAGGLILVGGVSLTLLEVADRLHPEGRRG